MLTRDEGEIARDVPSTTIMTAHLAGERGHGVPSDAYFGVWRKPAFRCAPFPTYAGVIFANNVFSQKKLLLVCFARTGPHEWGKMKFALRDAEDLRMPTLFVVAGTNSDTNAAFAHLNELTKMHGIGGELRDAQLAFVPDPNLIRHLGIGDGNDGIHNSLFFIKNGKVVARWVSRYHDDRFSWLDINNALDVTAS
jgi:hypothetical protein